MENDRGNLTIGTFARAAGVNVETIRFYQRKGLLPEPALSTLVRECRTHHDDVSCPLIAALQHDNLL